MMKFMLLVVVLDQSAPNYMHAHYDTYGACVAGFQEVAKAVDEHPVKMHCATQADRVALVVEDLERHRQQQHSVHYSYPDCQQASRELQLNYSHRAYCTQYETDH